MASFTSNGTTTTAATGNRKRHNKKSSCGIDTWLQQHGKTLAVGGELRIKLIKGPPMQETADPVDPNAPKEKFPAILKFPVSTVQPDFTAAPWNSGRLYQQDVPKPEEDEEDDDIPAEKKRRWRYNRNTPAPRQWILQEEVDFLETMVDLREKHSADGSGGDGPGTKKASTRYEGTPEHNGSHFLLLRLHPETHQIIVTHTPTPEATVIFQQPAVRKTLTLSEAEQAIQDQRNGIVRTAPTPGGPPIFPRRKLQNANNTTKNRLLSKLKQQSQADEVEEGDDVMADVKFEKRKGGGGARRELLNSMAGGMSVSTDGVLGGTNDAAFAGRQRFAKLSETTDGNGKGGATQNTTTERGADGAAMSDDFYTRDVSQEYEELDYDANEEFADDDVDVGESEILNPDGDPGEEEDDDEEESSGSDEEESVGGVAGLASAAGFKAMLAKARGEAPAEVPATTTDDANKQDSLLQNNKTSKQLNAKKNQQSSTDHMSKLLAATQKPETAGCTTAHRFHSPSSASSATAPSSSSSPPPQELQLDENGQRVITLESVRQEIWLNHGQIPMKRLMKIFKINKNATERKEAFRIIIKELCTVTKDHPVHGNMFVLKQHYRY